MGDQETFKASVWYNGEVVNEDGNNPRYVGGTMKLIDVDPNTEVQVFLRNVRDISGIPEAVPITVKYHIFFSLEISKLLDITTSDSLMSMLQPGLMLHPFYVEKNVAEDGTDTNSNEPKCRRSARKSKAIQSPPTGVEMQSNKRSKNAGVIGDRVGRTSSTNSSQMQIFIKSLSGWTQHLHVDRTETVESMKERISKTKGIAVEEQRLMYACKLLEDDRTLAYYGIADESLVHLVRRRMTSSTDSSQMRVIIKSLCGREKPLDVEITETVESIKERLRKIEGIPIKDQRLIYAGRQLEDDRTLEDYNIFDGDVIQILLCLKGC